MVVKRGPKWESFKNILLSRYELAKAKIIIFTESQETAEYIAGRITGEVEPRVLMVSANSSDIDQRAVAQNFDKNDTRSRDDYRILVATEISAEGINPHRLNIVINYDIPWNPAWLIQRVGRVNRVDTDFDTILTLNFFPADESNSQIKLTEAAVAKL
jgi:superfamily II DNA/RNA helicase